jgi:hypothetical protein
MLPLSKQIQIASDCRNLRPPDAKRSAGDAGYPETTFEELRQRLAKTIDYVKALKPAQFEGGETREITFPTGPNTTLTLKGQQYVSAFAFPNFYFHAAIAHGILRHNGVEVGKRDFLGVN